MRITTCFFLLFLFVSLGSALFAQDAAPLPLTDKESTWRAHYNADWIVEREEDGTILSIPEDAIIRSCGGIAGKLTDDLQGVRVGILWEQTKDGEDYVIREIQIICE